MITLMSVQGLGDGKSFELGNLKKGAAAGTEVARLPSHRVQPLEPAVLEERIGAEWGHLPPPPVYLVRPQIRTPSDLRHVRTGCRNRHHQLTLLLVGPYPPPLQT